MLTTPQYQRRSTEHLHVCIGEVSLNHVHASTETGISCRILPPVDSPSMLACSAALLGVPRGLLGRFSEDASAVKLGSLLTSPGGGGGGGGGGEILPLCSPVSIQTEPTRTAEVFSTENGGHERNHNFSSAVRTSVLPIKPWFQKRTLARIDHALKPG